MMTKLLWHFVMLMLLGCSFQGIAFEGGFVAEPENIHAYQNSSVIFRCLNNETGSSVPYWIIKNQTFYSRFQILQYDSRYTFSSKDGSLILNNVVPSDNGTYQCLFVRNQNETLRSQIGNLTVFPGIPDKLVLVDVSNFSLDYRTLSNENFSISNAHTHFDLYKQEAMDIDYNDTHSEQVNLTERSEECYIFNTTTEVFLSSKLAFLPLWKNMYCLNKTGIFGVVQMCCNDSVPVIPNEYFNAGDIAGIAIGSFVPLAVAFLAFPTIIAGCKYRRRFTQSKDISSNSHYQSNSTQEPINRVT